MFNELFVIVLAETIVFDNETNHYNLYNSFSLTPVLSFVCFSRVGQLEYQEWNLPVQLERTVNELFYVYTHFEQLT
mgnify:CR=1 FL=1